MRWLAIVALFCLVGCEPLTETEVKQRQVRAEEYVSNKITYIKDDKTGLCFAYFSTGIDGGPALATVPCEAVGK